MISPRTRFAYFLLSVYAFRAVISDLIRVRSIDFLHLRGLLVRALNLLKRRQIIISRIVVVVDAQAELDHEVDAPGELRWLIQREARSQQGRVKQEPDEILHGLVRLVRGSLLLELRHDGVV